MAMLTAYFDESNTKGAVVVAGLLGKTSQWERFNQEWRQLLAEYQISHVHMREFAHFRGEFSSWKGDEGKRRSFIDRIIGVISRRSIISVGIVLDVDVYKDFVTTPERKRVFVNPYTTASYLCLLSVGRWADKRSYEELVAYVFDRGNPHRRDFEKAYSQSAAIPQLNQRYRLGRLSFGDDKDILPLQGSDFIAYEISKTWTQARFDERRRSMRVSMRKASDKICNDWRVVTPMMLRAIAADAGVA